MMMTAFMTKANILKKLEMIFWHAVNNSKWHIALQAAALQGKNIGMFQKQHLQEPIPLKDMNEVQLEEFIGALEKIDPELKNLEEESVDDLLKKKSAENNFQPELTHPPP
jgi:hypothetical protein